jgi:hypothetical protein
MSLVHKIAVPRRCGPASSEQAGEAAPAGGCWRCSTSRCSASTSSTRVHQRQRDTKRQGMLAMARRHVSSGSSARGVGSSGSAGARRVVATARWFRSVRAGGMVPRQGRAARGAACACGRMAATPRVAIRRSVAVSGHAFSVCTRATSFGCRC